MFDEHMFLFSIQKIAISYKAKKLLATPYKWYSQKFLFFQTDSLSQVCQQ